MYAIMIEYLESYLWHIHVDTRYDEYMLFMSLGKVTPVQCHPRVSSTTAVHITFVKKSLDWNDRP